MPASACCSRQERAGAARVLSSGFASPCLVWCHFKDLDEPRKAEQVQFVSIRFLEKISSSLTNVYLETFPELQEDPEAASAV